MIAAKLLDAARNFTLRSRAPGVTYISDGANWANDTGTREIVRHLRTSHGVTAHLAITPRGLRNQLVHFIDRHALLRPGAVEKVHLSNRIVLTWFHQEPVADIAALRENVAAVLPRLARVIVPCEATRRDLPQFGVPEEKIALIPLGVDTNFFRPPNAAQRAEARSRFGIADDAVCIGSFQKDGQGWNDGDEPKLIKGPDVFLRTIEHLHDAGHRLHVLLSGPARGFVRHGLEKLGVQYSHTQLGQLHEILGLYHALDLYLIASRCEGGPLALGESWATGVPVVSSRMGMPADRIEHGKNGLLADSEDAAALAAACTSIIASPELRENIRTSALADVARLDWSVIAAQHLALYRRLGALN